MEQGRRRDDHVIAIAAESQHGVDIVPHDVAMGQHGALGQAGGAGGVHDDGDVVQVGGNRLPQGLGHVAFTGQVAPAVRRTFGGEEMTAAQLLPGRLYHLAQGVIHHQAVDARVIDDEGEFLGSQAKIQGHKDCTQSLCCEHGLQQCRVIEPQVAHPVAHAHARLAQHAGLAPHPVRQFSVAGFLSFENHREAFRVQLRAAQHGAGNVGFYTWSVHQRVLACIYGYPAGPGTPASRPAPTRLRGTNDTNTPAQSAE